MPKLSRTQLFHRSRDTRLLFRIAVRIAVISALTGLVISLFTAHSSTTPFLQGARKAQGATPSDILPDSENASIEDWAQAVRFLGDAGDLLEGMIEDMSPLPGRPFDAPKPAPSIPIFSQKEIAGVLVNGSSLPAEEKRLLKHLIDGLYDTRESARIDATHALRQSAGETPPPKHAAEFLGDVLAQARNYAGAIDAYQQELENFPQGSHHSMRHLLRLLRQEERTDEVDALMDRAEYRSYFGDLDRIDRAVRERDYSGLLWLVTKRDLSVPDPWLALLSLLAGTVWFAITTQFAGHRREQRWFYAAALILGYFSATATLYAVYVQEHIRGFTHDPAADVLDQLIYCVAGIALREETLKLLFFVPLVPFLIRRGTEIDALVCAGLVGLGFAINENLGYVDRGAEFTAWSRFLTANFAHIAWTGIVGLGLFRFWRWPKRQWDNLLYDFLIVVASHGAYDALILVPSLNEYAFATIVIFALIAYLYLDQASHLMKPQGSLAVSPLAVFVVGGAGLLGITFCYACWAVPFPQAAPEYVRSLAEVVPVAFIFINRLRSH